MTIDGLIGAVVFLALGMLELALVNRSLYPSLRWRYEQAKTTQEQGLRPQTIMLFVKIQSLILMPLIGLFLGERMKDIFG